MCLPVKAGMCASQRVYKEDFYAGLLIRHAHADLILHIIIRQLRDAIQAYESHSSTVLANSSPHSYAKLERMDDTAEDDTWYLMTARLTFPKHVWTVSDGAVWAYLLVATGFFNVGGSLPKDTACGNCRFSSEPVFYAFLLCCAHGVLRALDSLSERDEIFALKIRLA